MERGGYVYILTNKYNTVLYVGVTSKLKQRIYDHRFKTYPKSFSKRYNLYKLVYFEFHSTIEEAIYREKQLKAGSRQTKLNLINKFNESWKDLWDDIQEFD
ncbi:MAG: GIY-YIG nuclease family protein [Bacteroidales bacterium]|nr:GIY-YIG nuclease family protein [Bacteroidales bacterium]